MGFIPDKKMRRRYFLAASAYALAALAQEPKKEEPPVIAGATQDPTPRVGVVLSSFKEGEDHDGTKIKGVSDPKPPAADLTPAQFEDMVRRAIDAAARRTSQFYEVIEPEDWVVILTRQTVDARIVRIMISYLAEQQRGLRYTIIDRLPSGEWSQEYTAMAKELGAKFPKIKIELVDLAKAPTVDLPVQQKANTTYTIPKLVQQCDKLISIAPLSTDPTRGVSMSVGNYAAISAKPVANDEALVDLFSYKPADFAVVGGSIGFEGDGAKVHHNLVIAGEKAPAVDSIAAQVMGFKPEDLPFLALAGERGFGIWEPDAIWTRGNEIEEAKHDFKKPAGWRPKSK
jgi:uncharacterized protein (DUF362 family)